MSGLYRKYYLPQASSRDPDQRSLQLEVGGPARSSAVAIRNLNVKNA